MQLIERGSGDPLVLIPGIQGRWEYLEQAFDALARWCRVITFPLCDEPAAGVAFDPARPFDSYARQVRDALHHAGTARATICGVSFGGLIALRFAAAHPERTSTLILVSTPGPAWHLRRRHKMYARLPRIAGPLFLAETPWRLRAEIRAALGSGGPRWRFVRGQLHALRKAPVSLPRMAARALPIESADAASAAARVTVPTLVVTGERALDHVVAVDGSSEYARLIPHARSAVLERSGHLGSITRPALFAGVVREFVVTAEREGLRSSGRNDAA